MTMFTNSSFSLQLTAPLAQVANALNSTRSSVRLGRHARKEASHEVTLTTQCPSSTSNADILLQMKTVLSGVGLPSAAQYVSVKSISIPLRKALDKTIRFKELCEHQWLSSDTFYQNKTGFTENQLIHSGYEELPTQRTVAISLPLKSLLSMKTTSPPTFLQFQQTRFFRQERPRSIGLFAGDGKKAATGRKVTFKLRKAADTIKEAEKESYIGKLSTHEQLAYKYGMQMGKEESRADKHFALLKSYVLKFIWLTIFVYIVYKVFLMFNKGSETSLSSILNNTTIMPVDSNDVKVRFSDVKGCDEAKEELQEVVNFLRYPDRYKAMGARLPKGVLLVGPPGNGKTLLAKAVAGEAQAPFFQMSGSEFDEIFVGTGSRKVRQLFAEARKCSPAVIFIDEIDSVGGRRTNSSHAPYANQTINQLLAEMDGFPTGEGIIVIGATNRPNSLDPALLRPGRFDLTVNVLLPDKQGRLEIIDFYLSKIKQKEMIDTDNLARRTIGFSGADLENLINQAAICAVREGAQLMDKHIDFAKDNIQMGLQQKNKITDLDTMTCTAYHEAGHTVVKMYTKHSDPVHKVTIRRRGHALGFTASAPEKEIYGRSKSELLAVMDGAMGGRVAEELQFGKENVTTGASSDFNTATSIAEGMVMAYGMSDEVGPRTFSRDRSDKPSKLVDKEVNRLLSESYARAKSVLESHRSELTLISEALLEYETLDADDLKILQKTRSISGLKQKKENELKHKIKDKLPTINSDKPGPKLSLDEKL